MLQSARAFVSSSWQPQLVLYCSGLCHGAMPHCVSHDLFACCEAAPLCPGTAKLGARTQLERDGVHPPDFSEARRRVSSVPRWSLQLSRQRGEPGALHSHLGRQPSYPVSKYKESAAFGSSYELRRRASRSKRITRTVRAERSTWSAVCSLSYAGSGGREVI